MSRAAAAAICLSFIVLCETGQAQIRPRIIGGRPADQGEYPWMAALYDALYTPYEGQFCGGVLIDPHRVLTAAHCVESFGDASQFKVLIGRTTLSSADGQIRSVKGWAIHPAYDSFTLAHDVALVLLESPVDGPVLPLIGRDEQSLWTAGTSATVLGWGSTAYDYMVLPDVLQEVEIPIVSDAACQASLGRYFLPEVMLCAGVLGASPGTGLDPCYGDSGGPLLVKSPSGDWRLVGLVDWGFECGSDRFYGVFTEIAPHLDWILSRPDLPPVLRGAQPAISGAAMVGGTLHCSTGEWEGSGVTFSYQWLKARGELPWYAPIPDAAADTYQPQETDIGYTVKCVVIAGNSGGWAWAESDIVGPVQAFQPGPQADPALPPMISGTAAIGETLTCQDGGWLTLPEFTGYQWLRITDLAAPAEVIPGAVSMSYAVVADDVGLYLACRVTGTSWNGESSVESAPLGPVSGLRLYDVDRPAVVLESMHCRKSGCRLRLHIDDGASSSGIREVGALIVQLRCSALEHCSAFKPRWLKGEIRGDAGLLELPKLSASGRYLAIVTATDNNGNVTDPPARIRLRRGAVRTK